MTSTLNEWERAEQKRSAFEASQADTSSLVASAENIARYVNPPADTLGPLEYAFHLLGDVKGKVVLEYGCGDGVNTILLANRGAHVISLDVSPELIDLAQKRVSINRLGSGVDFIVGSAHNLPLPNESVDVVFGIAILHHLDLGLSSREVMRVLKKGGRGIFQEPVRNSKLMRFVRKMIPYKAPDVSPYERPLTDRELKDFASGFTYRARPFQLPTSAIPYYLLPFWRDYTTTPLLRLDATLLERIPALGYYSPVRVFEVTK